MEEKAYFDRTAAAGLQIYYYPNGRKDASTNPLNGIIQQGYPGGVADIAIFPLQDGTVWYKEHIWPLGHPKLMDMNGLPNNNAKRNGAWELTPWSKAYMDSVKDEPRPEVKKKARS